MNCARPTCGQPILPCGARHTMGSCWYWNCLGAVHSRTGQHACEDMDGDATPGTAPLPLIQAPAGKPQGEVA